MKEMNVIEGIKVKLCPFCGSNKSKLYSKNGKIHYYEKDGMKSWQNVVMSVRCNSCHARGGTASVDLPSGGITTQEMKQKKQDAITKAIEKWNERLLG